MHEVRPHPATPPTSGMARTFTGWGGALTAAPPLPASGTGGVGRGARVMAGAAAGVERGGALARPQDGEGRLW